jgi:hypothetical protein
MAERQKEQEFLKISKIVRETHLNNGKLRGSATC